MKNIRAQLLASGVLHSSNVVEQTNAYIARAKAKGSMAVVADLMAIRDGQVAESPKVYTRSHAPRMYSDVSQARTKKALAILEATMHREAAHAKRYTVHNI